MTTISALLGKPVSQSISPHLFALLAKQASIDNYFHLKMDIELEELERWIAFLVHIRCRGFNVTMPYKFSIMKYIKKLDSSAIKAGAVNCVTIEKDGSLLGFNTDGISAWRAMSEHLKKPEKGELVLVLGSGGAAISIIAKMLEFGLSTHVLCHDDQEGCALNTFFGNNPNLSIEKLSRANLVAELKTVDYLINATPVGMWPNVQNSLVSNEIWDEVALSRDLSKLSVFDAILNPYKTKLLKDAEMRGAKIASGLWMMIYQGLEAFKLWTKIDISPRVELKFLFEYLIQKLP